MSIRCEIGGVLRQLKERSGTQGHFLAFVKESCGTNAVTLTGSLVYIS